MTGVKHERGAALDLDVANTEKEGTSRFADPLNAESLTAGVVAPDHGDKIRYITAFAMPYRRSFRCSGH